jgi:hypothetical protein
MRKDKRLKCHNSSLYYQLLLGQALRGAMGGEKRVYRFQWRIIDRYTQRSLTIVAREEAMKRQSKMVSGAIHQFAESLIARTLTRSCTVKIMPENDRAPACRDQLRGMWQGGCLIG